MLKFFHRRSHKSGLPPGTPVHIGERRVEEVSITLIDYNEAQVRQRTVEKIEDCFPFRDMPTVTWINVEGLHDMEAIQRLGDYFGLHPLVQEDIVNTDQRPKIEEFDDYAYIVIKMLHHNGNDPDGIAGEQVSLVLGSNFVLSFEEGSPGDAFDVIRDRVLNNRGSIRKMGADYLAYALIDAAVDQYFGVLERYGERIETVEDEVLANPTPQALHAIQQMKREMIFLRKSIWPLREVVNRLEHGESPRVRKATRIYLRDVYDHTVQVIETIEIFRDMLSGILDIYLSSVSNRMNEVMKVLTIYASIFIPLTFLAGVYGMNFDYMPELKLRWAYPALWLFMLAVAAGILIYFKRKKWM